MSKWTTHSHLQIQSRQNHWFDFNEAIILSWFRCSDTWQNTCYVRFSLVDQHLVVATVFEDFKSWDSANAECEEESTLDSDDWAERRLSFALQHIFYSFTANALQQDQSDKMRSRKRFPVTLTKPWPEHPPPHTHTISSTPYYCRISLPTNINRSLLSWLLIP